MRDNFSVKLLEGDLNVLIDLNQEPAAFPEPSDFEWLIGGQALIRRNGIVTSYSSIILILVLAYEIRFWKLHSERNELFA